MCEHRAGWSRDDSDWLNFEFIHIILALFLKIQGNNEIARNHKIAEKNEIRKYQDFFSEFARNSFST